MSEKLFSAIFVIVFMVAALAMVAAHFSGAVSKTETPTGQALMNGAWTPVFEKNLNETLPVFEPSRNLWGKIEYAVFGEGRKGVIVGKDGWLFTDEEFSCIPKGTEYMERNLSYIGEVGKKFKDQGIKLAVVLIPSKARLYKDYLGTHSVPDCRMALYSDITSFLKKQDIKAVALLQPFRDSSERDTLFLKTDTHWTTQGARMAAILAASEIDTSTLMHNKAFATTQGGSKTHDGDLLRYLPGVKGGVITSDNLIVFDTQEEKSAAAGGEPDASQALFSEDIPPVTLIGTSYSANPAWNFHGFLKDSMDVDILNMADEGLGPFTVMDKYLSGDALKNTPPQLVVWEIPERYITTKSEFLYK